MTRFPMSEFLKIETPFYYYDLELLDQTMSELRQAISGANYHVHYAVKANANPIILERICKAGLGADVVSGGEITAAIRAGFQPCDIVFAGVGKTDKEICQALTCGVGCFNVESEEELEVINALAGSHGTTAHISLRVNPDIDAHTHKYITTGLAENKFGIDLTKLDEVIDKAIKMAHIDLKGLHFHIGSQITDMTPFEMLCGRINDILDKYDSKGIHFESINVGGGLGIDYSTPEKHPIADFRDYINIFRRNLKLRKGQSLHFELGRAIVAQCGSLITRVVFVKKGVTRQFAIVDAGMTDLIRPALYNAHHKIEKLGEQTEELHRYDIVGPVCESSDVFGTDEVLPLLKRGDLLAIRSAGAYGEIMASGYNCRPHPQSVFSK